VSAVIRGRFTIGNAKKCTEEGCQNHCPQTNSLAAFDQIAMMVDSDGDGGHDHDHDHGPAEQGGSVARAGEADSAPARSAAISAAAVAAAVAVAAGVM